MKQSIEISKANIFEYLSIISAKIEVRRTRFLMGLYYRLLEIILQGKTKEYSSVSVEAIRRSIGTWYNAGTYVAVNGFELEYWETTYRKREFVISRHVFSALMQHNTSMSLNQIGTYSVSKSRKRHASMIHSRRVVDNLLTTDKKFSEDFYKLAEKLNLSYEKKY